MQYKIILHLQQYTSYDEQKNYKNSATYSNDLIEGSRGHIYDISIYLYVSFTRRCHS